MLIVLPSWYIKAEEILKEAVWKIIRENNIDITFAEDSKDIEHGKDLILNSLVRIYENVDVEGRERMTKFEKDMKKIIRKEKKNAKKKEV